MMLRMGTDVFRKSDGRKGIVSITQQEVGTVPVKWQKKGEDGWHRTSRVDRLDIETADEMRIRMNELASSSDREMMECVRFARALNLSIDAVIRIRHEERTTNQDVKKPKRKARASIRRNRKPVPQSVGPGKMPCPNPWI